MGLMVHFNVYAVALRDWEKS